MSSSTSRTSAVVTGAARGIGRAVAVRLLAAGHDVVVTDLDPDAVAATAAEIGATGVAQDVRDPGSHRAVAAAAVARAPLGVWVNNAGVGFDGDLAELPDEQVRALVEVNLLGTLWGMRAALAAYAAAPGGRGEVVNVASLSGLGPVPGLSVYAATKAAVVSITTSVALEAPEGVGVHAVLPDGVATPMVEAMHGGTGQRLVESGGRLLTTEEIAEAVLGLVGSRRVLRTVPGWRGAAMRAGALVPSAAGPAMALFEAQGRRRAQRRSTS
ncbi:SDR family NAD(P)-dependent oxidoreductase [Nocardioides litoris]|uniref:SDR family NAD(P)-dependent oxidoreductase n=1 Tax=Nocardioides litoris TaxID=1926648 RepID=UPI001B87FEEB|nr:SDR family oxidoreductase [Nocardioides litoris]